MTTETITSDTRPDVATQTAHRPTAHIGELHGLILRSRQHLIETEKETSWRKHRLEEAEQQIIAWAESFLAAHGAEPPKSREVSAKWGWWRRIWREYQSFSATRTLVKDAIPWLEAHKQYLLSQPNDQSADS